MDIPDLLLSGPDSIAASIPFIVGFTPRDSLVVMWLHDGRVRLTMRMDLPPAHAAPHDWADAVMAHRSFNEEVILCVIPADADSARESNGELHSRELISAMLEQLSETDCQVRDALLLSEQCWWSYLCEEPECCSPAGTPLDLEIAEKVAAQFVFAGVGRLPDRDAVIAVCAPDPVRQAANRSSVREAARARFQRLGQAGDRALEWDTWRDGAIRLVLESLIDNPAAGSGSEAEILLALCDVRVRDTVLWEIAHSNEHDPHRAFEAAAALLRGAPVGVIAPIGTVTALLGWLIGDGVRAMAALDRVWDEDPDYSLAELLGRSINAGLPPTSWREMMSGLTREVCRGAQVWLPAPGVS
jgi:hypothetical protein